MTIHTKTLFKYEFDRHYLQGQSSLRLEKCGVGPPGGAQYLAPEPTEEGAAQFSTSF